MQLTKTVLCFNKMPAPVIFRQTRHSDASDIFSVPVRNLHLLISIDGKNEKETYLEEQTKESHHQK